ncbi:MAG: hypothetical protein ACRCZP_10485, partial [Phycicoccus sp.]
RASSRVGREAVTSAQHFRPTPRATRCPIATVTFRTDPAVDQALDELVGGGDRSRAIREAILVAHRVRRAAQLRAEAEDLAADEADFAESRAVLADMESLRAW